MSNFIRVLLPIPTTLLAVPSETIAWYAEDALLDYIAAGTEADIPDQAVYAAELVGNSYSEIVAPPIDLKFSNHFAGWDPYTWPAVEL